MKNGIEPEIFFHEKCNQRTTKCLFYLYWYILAFWNLSNGPKYRAMCGSVVLVVISSYFKFEPESMTNNFQMNILVTLFRNIIRCQHQTRLYIGRVFFWWWKSITHSTSFSRFFTFIKVGEKCPQVVLICFGWKENSDHEMTKTLKQCCYILKWDTWFWGILRKTHWSKATQANEIPSHRPIEWCGVVLN